MFIDTHAHLDLLDDAAQALQAAREGSLSHIITVGIDLESSRLAAGFARENPDVSCSVGLHPNSAAQYDPAAWPEFSSLAKASGAVAIGECGLDYYRDRAPRGLQEKVFRLQIELAGELGLPLIIHNRDADEATLRVLREADAGKIGGVVHCYSSGPALAEALLELDFHLGFTGVLTYKKNHELREVAKAAPLERILIETDCPFLAPAPHRGKPNHPALVRHVAEVLAQCRGISLEEAAAATAANARRLFKLPEAA